MLGGGQSKKKEDDLQKILEEASSDDDKGKDVELEERKNEERLPVQSQQRYNKRKIAQVSKADDEEPISQPNVKRRRVVQDEQERRGKLVVLVGGQAKSEKFKKIVQSLGGKYIEDLDEEFDVYVTDDKLVRNSKLLMSMARGSSIVGVKWLEDSQKQKKFLVDKENRAEARYWIMDAAFEKTYNCSLKALYEEPKKLLEGKKVFVSPNI